MYHGVADTLFTVPSVSMLALNWTKGMCRG